MAPAEMRIALTLEGKRRRVFETQDKMAKGRVLFQRPILQFPEQAKIPLLLSGKILAHLDEFGRLSALDEREEFSEQAGHDV
jgi:hypothetical protein